MGIRALLVPVSGHEMDDFVLDLAADVGRAAGAHIQAMCMRPDPAEVVKYVSEWSYPVLIDDAVSTAERHAAEVSDRARALFDRWRARQGLPLATTGSAVLPAASWQERIGAPAEILRDAARFVDLVIMRGPGREGPVEADAMLESVIFEAGRPVLLVPPRKPSRLFGAAVIAWDGTPEALRALNAALPLLVRMDRVEVLTVEPGPDANVDALTGYLRWHGITAEVYDRTPRSHTIGGTLCDEVRRIDADLRIMGGYRHSRMREAVFGGTTRFVVGHCLVPIFMAH